MYHMSTGSYGHYSFIATEVSSWCQTLKLNFANNHKIIIIFACNTAKIFIIFFWRYQLALFQILKNSLSIVV